MPFEYLGAPWINAESLAKKLNALDLSGVRFRPVYFAPMFSKYQGEACQGIHVFVTDREAFRPVEMALQLIQLVKAEYPEQFDWNEPWASDGRIPIDLLTGGTQVREHVNANKLVSDLINQWQKDLQAFNTLRDQFLLY